MYMTVLKADFESLSKKEYPVDFENGEWMHKWLTSQCNKSRAEEKILYRIDKTQKEMYLYIQSLHEFPQKNLQRAGLKQVKSFILSVPTDYVSFKITCSAGTTKEGKYQFLQKEEERIDWVKKKLSPFMQDISVKETKLQSASIKGKVRLPGAEYEGYGIVTNLNAFQDAVTNGFGKAKNYGFGLMLYK